MAQQPPSGPGPPQYRGFTITLRHTTLGSDQPEAETSTLQQTTLATDRHPCPQLDSNPQCKQASGRRLTRPTGSARTKFGT